MERASTRPRVVLGAAALFVFVVVPIAVAGAGGSGGPEATASASVKKKVKKLKKQVKQLQEQVDNIQLQPGPPGPPGATGQRGPRGLQGEPGPANVVTRTASESRDSASTTPLGKQCNSGERAVGGGGVSSAAAASTNFLHSLPLDSTGNPPDEGEVPTGWRVAIQQNSGSAQTLNVYVLCAS